MSARYGDPVFEGQIVLEYVIVPFEMDDGTVLYDIQGSEVMESDEFFPDIQSAKSYARSFGS